MNGKKLMIDTNILINVLEEEKPFFQSSFSLLQQIIAGTFEGYISVISLSEIINGYYPKGLDKQGRGVLNHLKNLKNVEIVDFRVLHVLRAAEL